MVLEKNISYFNMFLDPDVSFSTYELVKNIFLPLCMLVFCES